MSSSANRKSKRSHKPPQTHFAEFRSLYNNHTVTGVEILSTAAQWNRWFSTLQCYALLGQVWHTIDPDKDDQDDDRLEPPPFETYYEIKTRLTAKAIEDGDPIPSTELVAAFCGAMAQQNKFLYRVYRDKLRDDGVIRDWIFRTVDLGILHLVLERVAAEQTEKFTTRQLLKGIKAYFGPALLHLGHRPACSNRRLDAGSESK